MINKIENDINSAYKHLIEAKKKESMLNMKLATKHNVQNIIR